MLLRLGLIFLLLLAGCSCRSATKTKSAADLKAETLFGEGSKLSVQQTKVINEWARELVRYSLSRIERSSLLTEIG